MSSQSPFAEYLSALDQERLTALLEARPDVRLEPTPRGFAQLAQRLDGADSLAAALRTVNRDTVVVGQSIAALGESATVPALTKLLGVSEDLVREGVGELCARGMAWDSSGVLRLSEQLHAHWSAEIGGAQPVAKLARSVRVEELRTAVTTLGGASEGLRKPELIARLNELMADASSLAQVIAALPKPARTRLAELRTGYGFYFEFAPRPNRTDRSTELLSEKGLLLHANGRAVLPREVAVAAWLSEAELAVTGRPEIPRAGTDETTVLRGAQAAAQEASRGLTILLDEARTTPIAALKNGGVGVRERTRLAKRLSLERETLALWIDVADAAGLLAPVGSKYAPTPAYDTWRARPPAERWAELVQAWFGLEHAPTRRGIEDDKEQPPPLPLVSGAGALRRALLQAERPGSSVSALSEEIDWFFPLHGYDASGQKEKVAAAVREAEVLGVIAADTVSELGEHLLAVHAQYPPDQAEALARRCAELLPETECSLILQSDLTAVVSGEPSVAASRLLDAAAVPEARGAAATWRFTQASVRSALDTGWTADQLLTELGTISAYALPQPLEYLITDVDRRHGQVRVRGLRCCILGEEATLTEIMHTRSLAKLHLSWLAPTVLSSGCELDDVLARLRGAGLAPVAEDADGVVIAEGQQEHQAPPQHDTMRPQRRAPLPAGELVGQLVADPNGEAPSPVQESGTLDQLSGLNTSLSDAELELLADAVDKHVDVVITYEDRNRNHTIREIQPRQLYGRWLDSWCHLRNGQRDFTVSNIEAVAPHPIT